MHYTPLDAHLTSQIVLYIYVITAKDTKANVHVLHGCELLHSPKKSGCMECDGLYVNVHVFALLRTKPLCGNAERHGVCDGRVAA
jgi:hypothetical protein